MYASAKAIVIEDGKVLLLRYGLDTWYSLPGGRQRYGETLAEALVRECQEEAGVTVEVGELLFTRVHPFPARPAWQSLMADPSGDAYWGGHVTGG